MSWIDHRSSTSMGGSPTRRTRVARIAFLTVATVTISVLHYATAPAHVLFHEIYQRSYYIPIIVGAYWYGVRGGLLTAALTSVAYVPHILMDWSDNVPYAINQYASLVMFHVIGALVGALATSERRLTARYREVAASLERANQELRDSHAQLARAERLSALGEMAAGLAHELRNPLAGVSGAVEIVAAQAQAGTPQAEFVGIAQKELRRLDDLLNRFLAYARPHPPALSLVEAHQLVEHVVTLLRPELERHGVSIEADRASNWPMVRVDPEQIHQVLLNVLLNAIQASPAGATVHVHCRTEPRFLVIDVADAGPGIRDEHLGRVFDPFFTTKEHGTGLGLAVSARIVNAHQGSIDARRNPQRGSTISIRLPLPEDGPAAAGLPGVRSRP